MGALLFAFTSYQSAHAGAKSFTAKPIQIGDSLLSILRANGFSEAERAQVLSADPGLRQLFLTLDTSYRLKKTPEELELRVFDSQTSSAFRIVKKKSSVIAYRYKPNFKVSFERVSGRISGSILGSILSKIRSNWVASRFSDAYAFDIKNSKSVSNGARFGFTVEKKYEDGQFIKYGEILWTSLEIEGSVVQKKLVRNKEGGVFINSQDLFEQRPLFAPVGYLKIASPFKLNRVHPITGKNQPHLGVDFELPAGYPVYSPRKGIIVRYGHNHAAGNYLVLRHSDGMETSFNHLHRIDKRVRQGLQVFAGEKIGEVGCTGYCTRAHLHFALKNKGRMVDPIRYMKPYPMYMKQLLENQVARN